MKDGKMEDYLIGDGLSQLEKEYGQMVRYWVKIQRRQQVDIQNSRKRYRIMETMWVHQMKTPLSAIRLIAENRKTDEDFRKILVESDRMNYYLSQMINMSKLQEAEKDLKIEKWELYDLVKDTVNDMKIALISKKIFPRVFVSNSVCIYTDGEWFKFVLTQLIANAIKYSPEETTIEIESGRQDGNIYLSVRDEGCGISKMDLPKIYDLFYTGYNGKNRGESTGMGLFMVKTILQYMGHEIEAKSVEGKGSEFTIWIKG